MEGVFRRAQGRKGEAGRRHHRFGAAALTALTAAENALVRTTTPPDTTVLDETIADMEKVNGSEYTTDSYKALTDAIAKAKSDKVKGDAGLNQQNIDA